MGNRLCFTNAYFWRNRWPARLDQRHGSTSGLGGRKPGPGPPGTGLRCSTRAKIPPGCTPGGGFTARTPGS
jgi:hypothetical protein